MHTASKERNGTAQPAINYHLKSEASITLCCQLCSTRYKAVRIKNCHVLPPNRHLSLSAKMNGTQRRTLVSPWSKDCRYCGILRNMSGWSDVEQRKIKLVALAIIELCLSEGISQSVTQSVTRKSCFKKYFIATCWKHFGLIWKLVWAQFYLTNTTSLSSGKWGWLLGDVFSWATPNPLWSLLHGTIVLYDITEQWSNSWSTKQWKIIDWPHI